MKHVKVVLEENILCKKESTLHKHECIHIHGQTSVSMAVSVPVCIWRSVSIPLHIALLMAIYIPLHLLQSCVDGCLSLQLTLSCGLVSEV
jgi:hypothetical protein